MGKWSETPWGQKFAAMSKRTTFLFGGATGGLAVMLAFILLPKKAALALAAALVLAFSAGGAASWVEDVNDGAKSSDSVSAGVVSKGVKDKGTFLLSPAGEKFAAVTPAKEAGSWEVEQTRPCLDGMVAGYFARPFQGGECGTSYEVAHNFLADEGEADLLACFYQSQSCPASFTAGLLSTAASPAETSTWASISSTELVTGTSAGYASWSAARSTSGWFGTTSGTAPTTIASGTGGCTETLCAQVSTAQNSITASGAWSVGARYIYVRATTSNRLVSVAQLAADRTLASGDVLNLTYRQAMQ